ncbi:uncharacterized protein MELLADRAFT_108782 [Melampsora larici-populina 98AG31]|uniref:RING-type domain-containing protein n=1 Tax=Melampsora larici-populina (strain 98AG31 / pathotype 3-4-7) TaxID=747676 RepID=F4RU83_MELLP|nr:uncharacterized protein MELLADRAFT_108782 [Melampsora larici-populina 98AG31]EGG04046.1 hypothetical protein MELLADRAFT_108782 [Melampsora larici-populina 98AG31]
MDGLGPCLKATGPRPFGGRVSTTIWPQQRVTQCGSPEWFSLYVFVCHTADLSHVVHQNSDLPEADQDKCPICAGIFQAGNCYIPLSCHAAYWLHKACLTELAVYSCDFLCPLCCKQRMIRSLGAVY